jgi:hypothetical protein
VAEGVRHEPVALRQDAPALDAGEQLVAVAVVLAVEHHHAIAAGDGAGDAERLGVGLGGRERELPRRQPEAPAEVGRHPRGVLGRQ